MAGKSIKRQGWVASLSNGETVFESDFKLAPGERSPWGQLIERCEVEGIWITQIQLQRYGRNIVGIHNADGYCFFNDKHIQGFRSSGPDGRPAREIHMYGIGSVIDGEVYCTLLDSQGQTRQDTRPLARMRLHCILKPEDERGRR